MGLVYFALVLVLVFLPYLCRRALAVLLAGHIAVFGALRLRCPFRERHRRNGPWSWRVGA